MCFDPIWPPHGWARTDFDDAIVIIHEGYANVIVDAASLSPADAAQIQNIVNKECHLCERTAFRIVSHNICLLITVTVINISLTVIEVNNDPKYNRTLSFMI